MDIPSYSNLIERLFSLLDGVLKDYVYNGYTALSDHLSEALGLAVTLYIILIGIAMVNGWRKMSHGEFMKDIFRVGLIYMFAMNWGLFSEFTVNGIEAAAGQIGDWFLHATPIPLPSIPGVGEGINGAIQAVVIEVTQVGNWTWDMGAWNHWGPLMAAMMIWVFGYLMITVAVIEILLAKLMLAILFAMAPLFIAFTLFSPTRGMFDRWLGAISGFCLVLVFVSAAVALGLNFMQWAIGGYYLEDASHLTMDIVGWVPLMVVSILCVCLILSVTHLAKAIGGSVSSATGSAMLGAAVGGFIGGSMSSMSMGRSAVGMAKPMAKEAFEFGAAILGADAQTRSHLVNSIKSKFQRGVE